MGAVLVFVSIAIVGWQGAMQYVDLVRWINSTHYTIDPANMPNLRGMFESLTVLGLSRQVLDLTTMIGSIGVLGWSVSVWKPKDVIDGLAFNLCVAHLIVITLLVSYHLYVHDVTLLLIPLTIVLNRGGHASQDIGPNIGIPLLALLVVSMPVVEFMVPHRLLSWSATGLVLLAFVLSRELRCSKPLGEQAAIAQAL
jgi:hypothetical protein